MTKSEAIAIFGSRTAVARALNLTTQAVSLWPHELGQKRTDQIVGAMIRLRIGKYKRRKS